MTNFLEAILPLCLSATGGAILIMGIFTLMGKADILLDFEHKHFAKKNLKTLARIESTFGIIFSPLLFFCASAILFENPDKIKLAVILLSALIIIYLIVYILFWVKKSGSK